MLACRMRSAALAAARGCALSLVLCLSLLLAPAYAAGLTAVETDTLFTKGASGDGWSCDENSNIRIKSGYAVTSTNRGQATSFTVEKGASFAVKDESLQVDVVATSLYNAGTIESGVFDSAGAGASLGNAFGGVINGGAFTGYATTSAGTITGGLFDCGGNTLKNSGTISGGLFIDKVSNAGTITGGVFLGGIENKSGGTASGYRTGAAYQLRLLGSGSLSHTDKSMRYYLQNNDSGIAYTDGGTANAYSFVPDSNKKLIGLYLLSSTDSTPTGSYSITSAFRPMLGGIYYEFNMPQYACTVYAVYEEDVTKEATPKASIDYADEQLTGLDAGASYLIGETKYTADANGEIAIDSSWFGTTLSIVKVPSASLRPNSDAQSLAVPARPSAPTGQETNETVAGKDDGYFTLSNYDSSAAYELSSDGGSTWSDATVSGQSISGLAAGSYQLRVKATNASFASHATSFTVADGADPTYTLNVADVSFGDVIYGEAQPEARAIAISSTGNSNTTITGVSVSSSDFTLNKTDGAIIAAGGTDSATYTVQPVANLGAGVHKATITVSYQNGVSIATATAEVSVTVTQLVCDHPQDKLEIRNAKAATYTEAGYTGDTYCTQCNTIIAEGSVIPALETDTDDDGTDDGADDGADDSADDGANASDASSGSSSATVLAKTGDATAPFAVVAFVGALVSLAVVAFAFFARRREQ